MTNSSFESQNVPFAYVDKRVGGWHGLFGGKETAVLTRALTAPELTAGLYMSRQSRLLPIMISTGPVR